jgi:hypothetical protein
VVPPIVHDHAPSAQPHRSPVRRLGPVRGLRTDGLDCHQPVRFLVPEPGNPYATQIWRCGSSRASHCRPCAARYRRWIGRVAADGMWLLAGELALLTLTSPGDVSHCKRRGCDGVKCSHERCLCTPDGGCDLGLWNPSASKRWNHLLVLIEREYGSRPAYFRGVEVQDGKRCDDSRCGRGALHFHVIVRSDYAMTERTLRRLAIRAGFGHSLTYDVLEPGSKLAAHYVSKYVAKAADERQDVPWTVLYTDPFTGDERLVDDDRPTYRTWSMSRSFGRTLGQLRRAAATRYALQEQLRALGIEWNPGQPATQPEPGAEPAG